MRSVIEKYGLFMTPAEVATELGITAGRVRELADSNTLRPAYVTPGGHRRYARQDVIAQLLWRSSDRQASNPDWENILVSHKNHLRISISNDAWACSVIAARSLWTYRRCESRGTSAKALDRLFETLPLVATAFVIENEELEDADEILTKMNNTLYDGVVSTPDRKGGSSIRESEARIGSLRDNSDAYNAIIEMEKWIEDRDKDPRYIESQFVLFQHTLKMFELIDFGEYSKLRDREQEPILGN